MRSKFFKKFKEIPITLNELNHYKSIIKMKIEKALIKMIATLFSIYFIINFIFYHHQKIKKINSFFFNFQFFIFIILYFLKKRLLNSFIYRGPYGNHFCFIFEILGVNLLDIIKRYEYKGVNLFIIFYLLMCNFKIKNKN